MMCENFAFASTDRCRREVAHLSARVVRGTRFSGEGARVREGGSGTEKAAHLVLIYHLGRHGGGSFWPGFSIFRGMSSVESDIPPRS